MYIPLASRPTPFYLANSPHTRTLPVAKGVEKFSSPHKLSSAAPQRNLSMSKIKCMYRMQAKREREVVTPCRRGAVCLDCCNVFYGQQGRAPEDREFLHHRIERRAHQRNESLLISQKKPPNVSCRDLHDESSLPFPSARCMHAFAVCFQGGQRRVKSFARSLLREGLTDRSRWAFVLWAASSRECTRRGSWRS